jgi:uncharacterized DUF497 family protein
VEVDWDEENETHLAWHEVSIEEAIELFYHPFLVVDVQQADGEERTFVVGRTDAWRILGLAYTVRRGKLRVITAFRPSDKNRERYLRRFQREADA